MTEQAKGTDSGDAAATSGKKESKEVTALSVKGKDAKASAITVSPMGSIWNRPTGPGALEIVEQYSEAGLRPIGASHMHIYGTILNNRPIMASNIRVAQADVLADHRPIFVSDLDIRDEMTLPGGRPVFASDPRLLQATMLPGGRPVASNDIDDPEALMGFID